MLPAFTSLSVKIVTEWFHIQIIRMIITKYVRAEKVYPRMFTDVCTLFFASRSIETHNVLFY